MRRPVEPSLFDVLDEYAGQIERGEIETARAAVITSGALTFCENFYAQFFQNQIGQEIHGFNRTTKAQAVQARLALRSRRGSTTTIQLITWFEELCDIYPNVVALGYGGGGLVGFADFHDNYLVTLLKRIRAWATAKKYGTLQQRARRSLSALQRAMKTMRS